MAKTGAKESYSQYKNILTDLKARKFSPFYLLMGEEPYYIDKLCSYISEHILTPEEQGFNQIVLYGSDVSATQIIETARRYPMMAQRQVVIVREAQQVKDINELEVYLRQAPVTTVLVVCYPGKSVDKRSVFYKAAMAKGTVLESGVLKEDEVADWIGRYASEEQVQITPEAAVMLADYLGTDLNKIVMEMDKLLVLLPQNCRKIGVEVVEQNVGISKEYSPFALSKALSYRDLPTAMRIARFFGSNPKSYPLVMTLSTLFSHFTRILKYHAIRSDRANLSRGEIAAALGLHPFFLNEVETAARNFSLQQTTQAIWLIRAYDGRNKSNDKGEATDGDLLLELLFKILT